MNKELSNLPSREEELITTLMDLMYKYNLDFIDVSKDGEMYMMKDDFGTPVGVCSI